MSHNFSDYRLYRSKATAVWTGVEAFFTIVPIAILAIILCCPILLHDEYLRPSAAWNEFWAGSLITHALHVRASAGLGIAVFCTLWAGHLAWRGMPRVESFRQVNAQDPHVFYDANARKELFQALFRRKRWSAKRGLYIAPHLPMPFESETDNLMVVGAAGSGKSNVLRALTDQAIARGDRILLLCNKGDVTASFTSDDSILIAAPHADSFALDFAADVTDDAACEQLAHDLVPRSNPPFWSDSARVVLGDIVKEVMHARLGAWKPRDIMTLALQDSRLIQRAIGKIDLSASPLLQSADPDAEDRTVSGILLTMRSGLYTNLRPLVWAWDRTPPERRFSIARWLADDYKGKRTVIVQFSPLYEALSTLVAGRLIRGIATRLADPQVPNDPARRVILALDEFHVLDRIDNLDKALAVGREKGLVTWIGMQSLAQITETYGEETANVLSDLFQIKIFGRQTPGPTAKAVEERLGTRSISVMIPNRNKTKESQQNKVEERKDIPTFGSTQLASELGEFPAEGVCRALVHAYGQAYILDWPLTTWNKKRDGFQPAAWLKEMPKA